MFASQVSQLSQPNFTDSDVRLDGGAIFLKFSKNHCLNLSHLSHLRQPTDSAKQKRPPTVVESLKSLNCLNIHMGTHAVIFAG